MADDSSTLTMRLPADIKERLERLAEATDRSKSRLAADAIRRYLDLEEWQVSGTQAGVREADRGEFASDEEVDAVFNKWRKKG